MLSPRRLGQYEILELLAEGGMAELYRARSSVASSDAGLRGFERDVAVKRILPHLGRDPEFVRLFLNEARIAATLRHPNVISMFEIGVEEQEYFIAMELLDGADLARLARAAGPLPVEHVIQIGIGACAGLHYAHERTDAAGRSMRIIHRDISPQNLFVTVDGAVKVLDFGIAKHADQLEDKTRSSIKGKVRYMSPEQCASAALDRRTDVFSLGVVLWELCAGQRLFRAEGTYQLMRAISESDAPRLDSVLADCPPGLSELLAKALMRSRDERFATAEELQLALEEFALRHRLAASSVRLGRFVRHCVQPTRELGGPAMATPTPSEDLVRRTSGLAAPRLDDLEEPDAPGTRLLPPSSDSAPVARLAPATASPEVEAAGGRSRAPWLIAIGAAAASLMMLAWVLHRGPGAAPATLPATLPVTRVTPPPSEPAPTPVTNPPPVVTSPPLVGPERTGARRADPKPASTGRSKPSSLTTAKAPPPQTPATPKAAAWDDMSPLPPP